MKKAILVGAAPFRSREGRARLRKLLRSSEALSVAVDGGYDLFRSLKLDPDLYIGDLDSVRRLPPRIPAIFLPHEKNTSDLRVALDFCIQMGVQSIEAWAVTGGRADHHRASMDELTQALSSIRELQAHGDDASFIWVTPTAPLTLVSRPGTILSLFNLHQASGITTQGLSYDLSAESLVCGSHGLSNLVCAKRVSVTVKKGALLVIIPVAKS